VQSSIKNFVVVYIPPSGIGIVFKFLCDKIIYSTIYMKGGISTENNLGSRFQIPGSRFQIPGSRFQVPDSRFQIPGSRFQIPGSRFQVPDSRFQVPGPRFQICKYSCFLSQERYRKSDFII